MYEKSIPCLLACNSTLISGSYIARFKRYVASHRELHLQSTDVDTQAEFVRKELRRELVMANYGFSAAAQLDLQSDPVLRRAIEELPEAERMAESFRLKAARLGSR